MTSVLLASGVPGPRQVQVFSHAARRLGGQTLSHGSGPLEPSPGTLLPSPRSLALFPHRQPEGQVRP